MPDGIRIVLKVKYNKFGEIADDARKAAEDAVAAAVFDAEAIAKSLVAVDTGNLKNSIMSDLDGLEGAIYTGVEYGVYQEFGTSFMPPHPYFTPAIEGVTERFQQDMKDIFGG